jgi:hypothetical protein
LAKRENYWVEVLGGVAVSVAHPSRHFLHGAEDDSLKRLGGFAATFKTCDDDDAVGARPEGARCARGKKFSCGRRRDCAGGCSGCSDVLRQRFGGGASGARTPCVRGTARWGCEEPLGERACCWWARGQNCGTTDFLLGCDEGRAARAWAYGRGSEFDEASGGAASGERAAKAWRAVSQKR